MRFVMALAGIAALAVSPASMAAPAVPGAALEVSGGACAPAGDLHFVCGLKNVEDLLPVDAGRWLVGSSYEEGSAGLYIIDTLDKSARKVSFSVGARPDPRYPGCTPPDFAHLLTHGLDVVAAPGNVVTVYAVNHGGRESVEMFRLRADVATAQWVGCVLLPRYAIGNAVAALPDGGFVVSKFLDQRDSKGREHLLAGQVNGTVYRWRTGHGFEEVPGTRLAGDNGLAVTKDGRWLFVNAYGTREVVRVALSGHGAARVAKVDFNPDNLRWTADGRLFVTGQFRHLGAPIGQDGWETVVLDPNSMRTMPLLRERGRPEFDDAASTVQVGSVLWISTFRGDRIAYRPAP
ncbi:MAG TPA: hypothetical protein VMF64_05145 [Steroidobacteraceae bacterium]|nr:hypothetical protein [Steroidobacteraceae bacterium]